MRKANVSARLSKKRHLKAVKRRRKLAGRVKCHRNPISCERMAAIAAHLKNPRIHPPLIKSLVAANGNR